MTMDVNQKQATAIDSTREMNNEAVGPEGGMGGVVAPKTDSFPAEKQSFAIDPNAAFEKRKQEAIMAGQETAGQVNAVQNNALNRDKRPRRVLDFIKRPLAHGGDKSQGGRVTGRT